MPKKRTLNIYKNYTDNDFSKAIQAVKNGMSQRKAAKYYSVPQGTLSDHLRGRVIDGKPAGRKPVLSSQIESEIAQKCAQAAEMGLGMSRSQVLDKVGSLTKEMKLKTPFNKNGPGKDWWYGFKARNPDITLRTPEKLTSVRARGLNSMKVGDYFKDLKRVIVDLGLENKPECIWNMDEKGVSLEHKPVKVVAAKSSRCTPGRVSNTRESNTIIASINAVGSWMPPLIIVKGKTEKSLLGYNTNEGPIGAKWTYQTNAWTNDILGVEWFTNIFLKECGQHRPQLLILDSHHSHEVLGLIEKAVENDIHILAFPSHTTHFLCPLDRCVFGPFSSIYNKLCSTYCQTPGNIINKMSWPGLFKQAFLSSFTQENIVSGFRSCGIVPWNPTSIPVSAFAPSFAFENETHVNLTTPGEHPLQCILTEMTITKASANNRPNQTATQAKENDIQFDNITDNRADNTHILDIQPDIHSDFPGSPSDPRLMSDMSASVLLPIVDDETRDAIETLISLDQSASGKVLYEVSLNTSDLESGTYDLGHIGLDVNTSNMTATQDVQDENRHPNWDSSVDTIFNVQPPPPKKSKSSKNTSHRLLTSEDIIQQKRENAEIKQKKEAAKQKREKVKELVAAKKLIENQLKDVRSDISALKD